MATAFATASDLQARGRALTVEQEAVAETLLMDASVTLRARVPRLDERLADGSLDRRLPEQVVCRMVTDALNNPGRLRSETVDEVRFEYDLAQLREHLQPTEQELALLRAPSTLRRPRGIGMARTRPVL